MSLKSPGLVKFWQSWLLVLLPLGIAGLVFFLFITPLADNTATEVRAQALAIAKAQAIDSKFELISNQLEGLSRLSDLRQALITGNDEALGLMKQEWSMMFLGIDRLVIVPLGNLGVAGLGEHESKLRNNIEKEIVQRAVKNEDVVIDAYRVEGHYIISFAKTVTAGNRKVGALVLSLTSDWLSTQLENLQGDNTALSAVDATSLVYQLSNTRPVLIVEDRAIATTEQLVSAKVELTSSDNIQLLYQSTIGSTIAATLMPLLLAVLAGLVVFGLLALMILRSKMLKLFGEDAEKLKRFLSESLEGEPEQPELEFAAQRSALEGYHSAFKKYAEKRSLKNSKQGSNKQEKLDTASSGWENPGLASNKLELEEDFVADEPPLVVPKHIFRAYDIRGQADTELQDEQVELIGAAIGTAAIHAGHQKIVVARDGRLSSDRIASSLIQGLLSTGCDVMDVGLVPTPVLYFATDHLQTQAGVMITGSHNPPEYNGLKIVLNNQALADQQIADLYDLLVKNKFAQGKGSLTSEDVVDAYIDCIAEDVVFASPLKIVLDCGNGAASEIAPMLFASLGSEVVPLFAEVDGSFPNHLPDPGAEDALSALIAEVASQNADLGLAFDGDADRVVAVSGAGEIIPSDLLLMLFAKDVLTRNPGADVVYDIKCSRNLSQVISSQGGRPVMWKSGHSRIKQKMVETGALLGGEFSGHFCFKERWFGFDDGLYSGARLVEILTLEGLSLDEAIAELPQSVTSREIEIPCDDDAKFDVVNQLVRAADFGEGEKTELDGLRVDYPEGWGLVRASNTSAKLTLRFEAETQEALDEIRRQFANALSQVGLTL